MSTHYEVIIAGLGAMGSAAAFHLASRGHRVLGFDRFHPPHNLGSSHGLTRIIREAYFEHPSYVPLVQKAYALWADLEAASGRSLCVPTGGLMIGPPNGALFAGARRSAEQHQLSHQILSIDGLKERFPAFHPHPNMLGVWEPRAGIVFPELAIETHLKLAQAKGATLFFDEPLTSWEATNDGVRVATSKRSCEAKRLLISAGAWAGSLLPDLSLPLVIERQVLFWFQPRSNKQQFKNCPIFICEHAPHHFFYGFPDLGDGVKTAFHHEGVGTDPDALRRDVSDQEVGSMKAVLEQFLPDANGPLKSAVVCMYTNTPDEHFILDRHPRHRQVLVASPCSGHGFKFSPVIGEIAANLLEEKDPGFDLSLFNIQRFLASP